MKPIFSSAISYLGGPDQHEHAFGFAKSKSPWGAWWARGAAAAELTSEYDPGWAGNGVLPFEAEAAQKAREAAARRMRKNAFIEGQPDQERLDALNASAPEMMTPAVMSAPTAPTDAAATSPPPMQDAGPHSAPAVSPSTPPWLRHAEWGATRLFKAITALAHGGRLCTDRSDRRTPGPVAAVSHRGLRPRPAR
jgi:hypothetical protein